MSQLNRSMLAFQNWKDLQTQFFDGSFDINGLRAFVVQEDVFKMSLRESQDFEDAVKQGSPLHITYTDGKTDLNLTWVFENTRLTPKSLSLARTMGKSVPKDSSDEEKTVDVIPSTVEDSIEDSEDLKTDVDVTDVTFLAPFMNVVIQGKVDTGADMSSLDASDIVMDETRAVVSYVCTALSDHRITMDLDQTIAVSSADGGVTTRPVVSLDVQILGKVLKNVKFNLNDRSKMDHKLLIGQNVLEVGDFLVDPTGNKIMTRD